MKRFFFVLIAAIILTAISCNDDRDEEKTGGSSIKTLNVEQGEGYSVKAFGQIGGLVGVSIDFECGIEYSTMESFGKDSTWRAKVGNNYSEGTYTVTLSPLESDRIYYYRAYYTNEMLMYYGEIKQFSFSWETNYTLSEDMLIGFWRCNDGYYYSFHENHTGYCTDSENHSINYTWSLKGDELELTFGYGASNILQIQRITDRRMEVYDNGDLLYFRK